MQTASLLPSVLPQHASLASFSVPETKNVLPQTRGYQDVSSVSEHQGFVNAVYRGILRCVAEVCACTRLHRFSLWKPFVDLIGPYKGLPMCIRFFRFRWRKFARSRSCSNAVTSTSCAPLVISARALGYLPSGQLRSQSWTLDFRPRKPPSHHFRNPKILSKRGSE